MHEPQWRLWLKLKQTGIGQARLGKMTRLSQPYISKIVNGYVDASQKDKQKIAKGLDCQVIDLWPNDGGTTDAH